jgi:zinc protease
VSCTAIIVASLSCASVHPNETIAQLTPTGQVVSVDSLTVSYTVNGLQVIQRPSYANDVVAVDLYFIGGLQQVTRTTAGIETLALRASEYGTGVYPDTIARFALAATGSRIVVDPENDWTLFGFRGLVGQFDSTWAVFADRVIHPTLDPPSIALVRSQLLREAKERSNSPDGAVTSLADSIAFPNHPYGLDPSGTVRSLTELTPERVRAYVTSQFVTSRMLLIIVGSVPRQQVERAVAATLGRLPHGAYSWHPPPPAPLHATSMAVEDRALSTNYIRGWFHGPSVTSPDYPAFEIATQMLSTQLQVRIRVDRGLSYAAYAPYLGNALSSGGIYVSTSQPDEVIPLIRKAVEHCRAQWEPPILVKRFIEFYITEYLMANETNEAQATSLARAQIYWGDYRRAGRAMALLRQVDAADVLRVSRKYMHDIQFAYVGKRDQVSGADLGGI